MVKNRDKDDWYYREKARSNGVYASVGEIDV